MKINRTLTGLGAILAGVAVGLGAFGAHALKPALLAANRLDTYQTAVDYHFVHALGILLIGLLHAHLPSKWLTTAGWLMAAGILVFSGSLYVLCLTGMGWLGAITPLGGVAFIASWGLVAWASWQKAL